MCLHTKHIITTVSLFIYSRVRINNEIGVSLHLLFDGHTRVLNVLLFVDVDVAAAAAAAAASVVAFF